MQLTDEQIMHYFEMCEDPDGPRCMECAYESENNIDCFQKLRHDVVCVYNRQKEEIERLKTEPYQFADIGKLHSQVKAEAVKEFAERLKGIYINNKRYHRPYAHTLVEWLFANIDNLVKELVGEGG